MFSKSEETQITESEVSSKLQTITTVITIGDSLTDPGSMDHRKLLGIFNMASLAGLKGESPDGCFTNGYVWCDYFAARLIQSFNVPQDGSMSDSGDQTNIPQSDLDLELSVELGANVHNYKELTYNGKTFFRYYAQGGLTSWNYKDKLSDSIVRFFSREILLNLDVMRHRLFDEDQKNAVSHQTKQETLVIEWSGANDFVTVNKQPSEMEADRSISARITNVEKMIHSGYQNFVLFNLPDLSLTPQFQAMSEEDQKNASFCCNYLNANLDAAVHKLSQKHPFARIQVFDINSIVKTMYQDPSSYGLDPKKLKQSLVGDGIPANEQLLPEYQDYFWWNELHPSTHVHGLNSMRFYEWITQYYHFVAPDVPIPELNSESEEEIVARFRDAYEYQITEEQRFPLDCCNHSHFDYQDASLKDILFHAQNGGNRTKKIMMNLGYLDQYGMPVMEIPAVAAAEKENQQMLFFKVC